VEDQARKDLLPPMELEILQKTLSLRDDIVLSFLFGSRAGGDHHEQSDWDIAILFKDNTSGWDNLGKLEEIRHMLSQALYVDDDKIDLVDLYRGGLSISATVVDEGIPLSGQDSLALAVFTRGYGPIWKTIIGI
jgi:predicted nucleotidyltransferase